MSRRVDSPQIRPKALSIADSARYIGVGPSFLKRLIKTGKIPAVRLGPRAIRCLTSDLDFLLTEHKRQEAGGAA